VRNISAPKVSRCGACEQPCGEHARGCIWSEPMIVTIGPYTHCSGCGRGDGNEHAEKCSLYSAGVVVGVAGMAEADVNP